MEALPLAINLSARAEVRCISGGSARFRAPGQPLARVKTHDSQGTAYAALGSQGLGGGKQPSGKGAVSSPACRRSAAIRYA